MIKPFSLLLVTAVLISAQKILQRSVYHNYKLLDNR